MIADHALVWPAARHDARAWLDRHELGLACKIIWLSDLFSDGLGVAAILLLAATLDEARRWAIARVALMVLIAGALADGVNRAAVGLHLRSVVEPLTWLGSLAGPLAKEVARQAPAIAAPHAAVATALAIGLGRLYPRGRGLFGVFALLAMLQRGLYFPDSPATLLAGISLGAGCWAIATPAARTPLNAQPLVPPGSAGSHSADRGQRPDSRAA